MDLAPNKTNFDQLKASLVREALQLIENIRAWGIYYAREKLGNEVVDQAIADQATNPFQIDDYQPTESQKILANFGEEELEPYLINAYADGSGHKGGQIDLAINLLNGNLFIDPDEKSMCIGLNIDADGTLSFNGAKIKSEYRLEAARKILSDLESAFRVVLEA